MFSSPSRCHSFLGELTHSICFVLRKAFGREAGEVWSKTSESCADLSSEFSELWIVPWWNENLAEEWTDYLWLKSGKRFQQTNSGWKSLSWVQEAKHRKEQRGQHWCPEKHWQWQEFSVRVMGLFSQLKVTIQLWGVQLSACNKAGGVCNSPLLMVIIWTIHHHTFSPWNQCSF